MRPHIKHKVLGRILSMYLRLVWGTGRKQFVTDHFHDIVKSQTPAIIAFWHGHHFLIPFLQPEGMSFATLISSHGDGQINVTVCEDLGIRVIRGSGDPKRQGHKKGGMRAFFELLKTLHTGTSVSFTADVPKISRRVGEGIIKLAQKSGRPILPVSVGSSRAIVLKSWDKANIHLPFSTITAALAEPISVSDDADEAECERKRQALEDALNILTERVYQPKHR